MKRSLFIVSLVLMIMLFIFSLIKGINQNEQFQKQAMQLHNINKAIEQQNFSNALLLTQTLQSELLTPSSLLI